MNAGKRQRIFWIVCTLLVMAIIFFLSSQASGKSEDLSDAFAGVLKLEHTDKTTRVSNQVLIFGLTLRKLAHIVVYAALAFCLYQAIAGARFRIPQTLLYSYLYAVSDEIHQHFSGRIGRWQDTLIDLVGIVLGILLSILFSRIIQWFIQKNTEGQKRHNPVKL